MRSRRFTGVTRDSRRGRARTDGAAAPGIHTSDPEVCPAVGPGLGRDQRSSWTTRRSLRAVPARSRPSKARVRRATPRSLMHRSPVPRRTAAAMLWGRGRTRRSSSRTKGRRRPTASRRTSAARSSKRTSKSARRAARAPSRRRPRSCGPTKCGSVGTSGCRAPSTASARCGRKIAAAESDAHRSCAPARRLDAHAAEGSGEHRRRRPLARCGRGRSTSRCPTTSSRRKTGKGDAPKVVRGADDREGAGELEDERLQARHVERPVPGPARDTLISDRGDAHYGTRSAWRMIPMRTST